MISIVLPAFNESDTLIDTVESIYKSMLLRGEDFEITIVENGSRDNTYELAQRLSAEKDNVHAYHMGKPDYGAALRKGFQKSKGEIIINFDVDFFDLSFLKDAVELIRTKHGERPEIVVGSKRAKGSNDERPFFRKMATLVYSLILKVFFGLKVTDTHGIKAFHRASVAPIEKLCRFNKDLFDTEMIVRSEKAGLRVVEIPVSVKESRPARSPIMSRIPRTLLGLAKMRIIFIKESFVRLEGDSRAKMQS